MDRQYDPTQADRPFLARRCAERLPQLLGLEE